VYNPAGIMLANLRALFGVVFDIVLLRRGPEHMPASAVLLAFVIGAYIVVDSTVAAALSLFETRRMVGLLLGIATTLLWYHVALSAVKKRERFVQTLTALFAISILFTPFILPMLGTVLVQAQAKQQPSQAFMLMFLFVVTWAVVIYVRIVSAAFDWPWPAALLLLIGQEAFTIAIFLLIFGAPQGAT
jgi:hypothetical protein